MNELRRILSDAKRRFVLFALPMLCLGLFLLQQAGGNIRAGWLLAEELGKTYRERVEFYRGKDPDEIAAEEESRREDGLRLYYQAVHVRDYAAYLETVQKQAELMSKSSLFGGDKNSFSYRNIQKTAADFKSLQGIRTVFGSDRAVNSWTEYHGADWFHLLVMILFVLAFLEEKRRGLQGLIRTAPKGRKKMTLSRLGILLGASAVFTLLFYGLPLGAAFLMNGGLPDLGRSIQSLEVFKTCTLHVSVGGWIALFFAAKAVCGFFVGVFFWFVLSFLEQIQLAWLVILGILAAEYLAKTLIAPQMALGFLRYVNIFSYISPTELLCRYQNMNFFGFPVGSLSLMAWLLLLMTLILTAGLVLLALYRHPFGNRDLLGGAVRGVGRFLDVFRSRLPIGLMESYKLLFLGGAAIFLAAGLWAGAGLTLNGRAYSPYTDPDAAVKEQYAMEIRGPVTQKTMDYLVRARELLENSPSAGYFAGGLSLMEQEVEARLQKAERDGYEPWILDQYTISNYYGGKVRSFSRWNGAVVLAFVILCAAPVFSFEAQSGTKKLLLAAPGGRGRVFLHKMLYLLFVTLLLWAVVFGREWTELAKSLGREFLAAPVRNAVALEDFPLNVSLRTFLVLLNLVRLAGLFAAACVTAWLSGRAGSWEKAALFAAALLLVPAALYYFGQEWAGWLSLLPFADGADALASADGLIRMLPVWIALSVCLVIRSRKEWTESR